MQIPESYDVLILGSGEAGKYLAWTLASAGKRTAMIERMYIGGSCPNIACLPSKNVIQSAKVASYFQRAEEFGIRVGTWAVHMPGVRDRKRQMVDALIKIHLDRYKASHTDLIMGQGRFVAPKTIEVTTSTGESRLLKGKQVFISTGSRATIQNLPGLHEARPLTHIGWLELETVPDHLLVLGGGYIGLELAQAMRRFGSKVTILERNERLAHKEDFDTSEALGQLFTDEGIQVCLGAKLHRVSGLSGERVQVHGEQGRLPVVIEGSHLLVATGRTPNTEELSLELTGVKTDEHGFVQVNDRLETSAEGIWAVGDCAGSPQFTHVAYDDFRIIRDNLAGGDRSTKGRPIPSCMFTDPEFARVGLTESEAKARGIPYRLFKIPMAAVLRAHTLSETRGFMKALVDAHSDRILGFAAFGESAGEVLSVVQLGMTNGLPYTAIRDSVLIHPTIGEGLTVLFGSVPTEFTAGDRL